MTQELEKIARQCRRAKEIVLKRLAEGISYNHPLPHVYYKRREGDVMEFFYRISKKGDGYKVTVGKKFTTIYDGGKVVFRYH